MNGAPHMRRQQAQDFEFVRFGQPTSILVIDTLAIRVAVFMIQTPMLSSHPRGWPNSV